MQVVWSPHESAAGLPLLLWTMRLRPRGIAVSCLANIVISERANAETIFAALARSYPGEHKGREVGTSFQQRGLSPELGDATGLASVTR